MKSLTTLLVLSSFITLHSFGQNIGIGTASPNSSAMLDVTSSNKGLLVPRVGLTSLIDAATIASPATSLLVYNTNAGLTGGTGYYYNSGTTLVPTWTKMLTSAAAGWSLTGNAGTNLLTNFIGTTDNVPLRFRVSNVASGFIDISTRSTFFGAEAGQNHTFANNTQSTGFGYQVMSVHPGALNTAVGAYALANNEQFGSRNSALGTEALFSNITGQRNVAVGHTSLRGNTGGVENVAAGDSSMAFNTNGNYNIAVGANALKGNITHSNNVALGYNALEKATASNNIAIGSSSMRNATTGGQNIAVGWSSLSSNTTGNRNVAIGYNTMLSNTGGEYNSAVGYSVLNDNTSGDNNTAMGYIAMNSNTSGANNVALGYYSLVSNNSGSDNVAVGSEALRYNKNSFGNVAVGKGALNTQSYTNDGLGWQSKNVAIGYEALYTNQPTTSTSFMPNNAIENTAVGYYALHNNTTGKSSTAVGNQALSSNTTGNFNSAFGDESLNANTTGGSNTSAGTFSMFNNVNGGFNAAFGTSALRFNTSGEHNTSIGQNTMYNNTIGGYNTAIGSSAGGFNNANSHCTFLGFDADQASGSNYVNSMALGYGSRITASYQVRIGNVQITSIGGYQPWSNLSDGRFKKNITEQVKGIDFIMALRPVTYNIDMNQLAAHLKEDESIDATGKMMMKPVNAVMKQQRDAQSSVVHTGFIAQEVEAAAKKLNYDFSGVDKPKTADDLYALRYSEFVVPLVKAVQEQQQEIIDLKANVKRLEDLVNKMLAAQPK